MLVLRRVWHRLTIAIENPQVNLHGGAVGFDDVDWEVLHPTQATLFSDDEKVSIATIPSAVAFAHTSPDGDEGFPGTLRSEVLVGLLGPGQNNVAVQKGEYALGSVVFIYRAKLTDEDKKVVTPVNLTQVRCRTHVDVSTYSDCF